MASYATGSVNFGDWIYANPSGFVEKLADVMLENGIRPEVEVFDAAMMYNAAALVQQGKIKRPFHVQFVLGIQNAMPVRRRLLEFLVSELEQIAPEASWGAAGLGRHQLEVNHWCLEMGGHCRTGLEDNIRYDGKRLARSNAELVERVAGLCAEYGRHPASHQEAREILGLAQVMAET